MPSPSLPDSLSPKRQRILVVDDDPAILQMLQQKLDREGFQAMTAASGQQALDMLSRQGLPHLALVDIRMPGMDGLTFCRLVQEFCDLPIIMLTSVDDEEVVINAIEQYAEDYIVKPFSPRELVARVRRVLRRIGDFAYTLEPLTRVDDHLAVDFAHKRAVVAGRDVLLTPTETKLLYLLMRNAGRVVTTDFLLRRLWPLEEVFEDTLRVHVHRLRSKIECIPNQPRYVMTERGLGYRFPPQTSRDRVRA